MAKIINWTNAIANYVKSGTTAQANYTAGVSGYSGQSPGSLAAANVSGYVNGVVANQGKWATNVAAVPTATWAQACQNKASRIPGGFSAAQPKLQKIASQYGGQIQSLVDQIHAEKSSVSWEQRVVAFGQGMKTIFGKQ